ncbi:PhzF family phenazine biosynthesis protein [Diaphorobacter ruginosibacter]|uniref:PhzF family phenazine biosynthesis protein n=1 Tax=Diaphorobacter ruginosibacter TaxID=1715720 RepID=A0A7G9RSW8_9BURK|nr:PhzF family phenazine biosynthesis protein [Diaphorobacter ruginosibacter]QNN58693.1 PhzF family phenazine biosynthesis protein [Diaphorobacter ruginosibacter]
MALAIHMVDVFGAGALSGNPLAVVIGADALDTQDMQRLTRWLNLSETAFLFAPRHPEADYRLRIFTLDREMPFAGHPTLGSCHVWLSIHNRLEHKAAIVQECGAGLVQIRRDRGRLAFAAPPLIRSGPPTAVELDEARQLLGIAASDILDAAWIDNGPGWLGIRLVSAEKVLSIAPARRWHTRVDVGVIGPHTNDDEPGFEVRAFFSDHRGAIVEDPVTGSLNASFAQWLFKTGIARDNYIAAQGTCLGRKGRIYLTRDEADQVWVGGETRTHVKGELHGL